MEDWLQLTEEDIVRAQQLVRRQSPTPDVITITRDDIPKETTAPQNSSPAAIKITYDDLTPNRPQESNSAELERLEMLMYNLVNAARQAHLPGIVGTGKLTWHQGLAAVARGHSADMIRREYVAHVSPEGITAARRIENHRIRYVACGENIGIVYGESARTSQAVHDIQKAFMNQPRSLTNHRGNVLNPIWTHIGIGIATSEDGSLVATQNFISAPIDKLRGR
ncbi:MAG: CAP domain-containing protein [Candidatus Promineifilaceae bacterium]